MRNLLELIYEYQRLRGKQDHLDVPLDEDEQLRLAGLAQLLTGDDTDETRAMPRVPFPKSVSFTCPGGFEAGEIKDLSGVGIAVSTKRPPAVGSRVILRVVDGVAGCELFFPCRVIWARQNNLPGMGLVFDGVPTKSLYSHREDTGLWKRSFTIGDRAKASHVA